MGIERIDTAYVSSSLFTFHASPVVISECPVFYYKLIIAVWSIVRHYENTGPADNLNPLIILKTQTNQLFTEQTVRGTDALLWSQKEEYLEFFISF